MTPNYISNSSADVSLWCNCEGSGNQWQECLKLQHIFTHNSCLRESTVHTFHIQQSFSFQIAGCNKFD